MNTKEFDNDPKFLNDQDIHPSKDIKSTLGTELSNKKIVLCITASVACYKSIDLIRLLMRHGAEVFVVISKAVEKFITSDYYLWASGNKVISELTGDLQHVRLADYEKSDLVIVYPATANTIGKFAQGIDDTPVTSVLSIALGSGTPIIISPAMHEAMYDNIIIKNNINKLEKLGVAFINPLLEEGKAKVASPERILDYAIFLLGKKNRITTTNRMEKNNESEDKNDFVKQSIEIPLQLRLDKLTEFFKNKKILITLGSTVEYIDPIRVISNTSSGKMGLSLIKNALDFGLDVTVVKGITSVDLDIKTYNIHSNFKLYEVKTSKQMLKFVIGELSANAYDIVIAAAAVSDFRPLNYSKNKINSHSNMLNLTLVPTDKIIDKVKKVNRSLFLVAFKADYCVDENLLLKKSYEKLLDADADLVVGNDVGIKNAFIGSDLSKIFVLDRYKNYYEYPIQSKDQAANNIFRIVYLKSDQTKI